jgi:hypothetical protein
VRPVLGGQGRPGGCRCGAARRAAAAGGSSRTPRRHWRRERRAGPRPEETPQVPASCTLVMTRAIVCTGVRVSNRGESLMDTPNTRAGGMMRTQTRRQAAAASPASELRLLHACQQLHCRAASCQTPTAVFNTATTLHPASIVGPGLTLQPGSCCQVVGAQPQ